MVHWRHQSFRYVHKTWEIVWFADTPGPRLGVSPRSDQECTDCTPGKSRGGKSVWGTSQIQSVHRRMLSWGVTLVTTSPTAIGWKSVRWRGRRTSTRSAKPGGNIPRRVTPQWYVQSNQNGNLFNLSPGTQETCSRKWRRWLKKLFCLIFSSERRKPSPPS